MNAIEEYIKELGSAYKDIISNDNANTTRLVKAITDNSTLLNQLIIKQQTMLDKQSEREQYSTIPIANQVVIPIHDIVEFEPVNNPKYNRARVFLDALFTPAHSAGLSIELFYNNNRIGEIMKVKSSNGSGGNASEPIDIAHLSGFRLVIRNHDQSQATTIKNLKVVLYNELISFNYSF